MIFKMCVGLFLIGVSANALAQGSTSVVGGGQGVSCRSGLGSDLEVLDLFEARERYGSLSWDRIDSTFDVEYYVNGRSEKRICEVLQTAKLQTQKYLSLDQDVSLAFDRACSLSARVKFSNELVFTRDAGETVPILSDCRFVQFGNYQNGEVTIRKSLNLHTIDVAAFLLHEALHPVFAGPTTVAIRQFVMFALADESFQRENYIPAQEIVRTKLPVNPNRFF
jgi:hypothetical protein